MTDAAALDLDAYRRRIGFHGPLAPTRDTLAALIAHHAAAIPFENLEVLAGRVPGLDLAALERKLVHGGRGGYCFEQNTLLLAVLRQVGFDACGLEARAAPAPPASPITGRTHMTVRVILEGEAWHADVGFGGLAPTTPLALASRAAQADALGAYRFVDREGDLLLQCERHGGWTDCYRITASEPRPIDYELANWWVATHPGAFLRHNLLLGRSTREGRLTLFNAELSLRRPGLVPEQRTTIATRAELADVLGDGFGLRLGDAETDAAMAIVAAHSTPTP